jgi:hypothetical protein
MDSLNIKRPAEMLLHTSSKWFVQSAGTALFAIGIAKIWSSLGKTKLLMVADPILGVPFGQVMLMVGLLEIGVGLACFVSRRQTVITAVIAWLAINFLVYRLGLWWINWKRPCGCLGHLTDTLGISPQLADSTMKGVLVYLLVGSYALLLWRLHLRNREHAD